MLSALFSRAPTVPVLLAVVAIASLLVHLRSLLSPALMQDDFGNIHEAWTWQRVTANLWVPLNEHCWPVYRLSICLMNQLSGGPTGLPLAAMVFSRITLLATIFGLFLFVKRERGPLAGLVSAAVFGVSAVYLESVAWFAAAPNTACLATGCVALLAAQRWVQRGQWWNLPLTAAVCVIAPGWFGGGALIGPLVSLYLFGRRPGRWWSWAVPLVGTAAYFAVCIPMAGDKMLKPEHHGGKSLAQAFNPTIAAENTARAVTDQLVLGGVGVWKVVCPLWVAVPVTTLAVAAGVWWWRRAGWPRVVLLGAAFVLFGYVLVFGSRAGWDYETLLVHWSRYATFPQFGLALIVGGGVRTAGPPRPWQRWVVLALTIVLLALHSYHGWSATPASDPRLAEDLQLVAEADRRCREHHIAGEDAVRVLVPHYTEQYKKDGKFHTDIWRCIWGSSQPKPRTDDEIRDLLLDL